MRKPLWMPALLLLAAYGAPVLHADILGFVITGADTGNLTITETAGSITAVSGTFDGATVVALLPLLEFGDNDNKFFSSYPYFDNQGVSFSLNAADSSGFKFINLWSDAGAFSVTQGNTLFTEGDVSEHDNIAPVPEPGTVLLTSVLLGIFVAKRMRACVPSC